MTGVFQAAVLADTLRRERAGYIAAFPQPVYPREHVTSLIFRVIAWNAVTKQSPAESISTG